MILKMIDLSLMAEHLPVHKAELDKLASYVCSIQDPEQASCNRTIYVHGEPCESDDYSNESRSK